MNIQTDKGGMNNTQRTTFVAGLIVLAVIGLHFAFGVRFPVPWVDESYFLLQSLSLAEHNTLVTPALIPDRPVMWMQPGYVLLTGLYFKAVDFSLLHARQLSLAFYAIAIWVYCRALCRDTGWLGAMVAAVIFLIPSSLAVSNVARMESIVLALGLGVLACTQHQRFVASAALTVLAALVHPNGAYFALPLAVGLWLARAEWRNALRQTAAGEWILLAVSVLLAGGYAAFVVRHLDAFQVDMAFQFARKLARKPFYLDPRAVVTLGLGLAVVVVCLRAGDYGRTVAAVFATTLVLIFANGQEMWYQVFRNVGLGMLILLAVTGLRASLPRAIAASVLLAGFCALFGLQFVGMRPGFTSGGPVAPRVSQSMEEQLAATRRAHPGPFTVAFNNTGLDMLYLDFLRREEITLVRRMPVEMTPAVTVDLCLHVVGADDPPWLHEDALAEFPDPHLCRLGAFVSRSGDEARLLDHEAYVAFLDTLRQAGSASTARSP